MPITIMIFVYLGIAGIILYLICLLIQVLQKYLKSESVRNEKKLMEKTLGKSSEENAWKLLRMLQVSAVGRYPNGKAEPVILVQQT